MRNRWKAVLSLAALGAVLAFAAPATVSAQIDCRQCTPSNYCEELCQWEFFGEFYFDVCRNWTYPCVEFSAAVTPEGQEPSFLSRGSSTLADAPVPAGNPNPE